jgi:hypothetical protein
VAPLVVGVLVALAALASAGRALATTYTGCGASYGHSCPLEPNTWSNAAAGDTTDPSDTASPTQLAPGDHMVATWDTSACLGTITVRAYGRGISSGSGLATAVYPDGSTGIKNLPTINGTNLSGQLASPKVEVLAQYAAGTPKVYVDVLVSGTEPTTAPFDHKYVDTGVFCTQQASSAPSHVTVDNFPSSTSVSNFPSGFNANVTNWPSSQAVTCATCGGGGAGMTADDEHRLDLTWWGVWALVGVALVALVAPRFMAAWGWETKV